MFSRHWNLGRLLGGQGAKGVHRRGKKNSVPSCSVQFIGNGAEREGLKAIVYYRSVDKCGALGLEQKQDTERFGNCLSGFLTAAPGVLPGNAYGICWLRKMDVR